MKITICSFAVNNKFPVDFQYNQFQKYIKEEFQFILFNDADNDGFEQELQNIAQKLNINHVRVPQDIHSNLGAPSICYAETLNWLLKYSLENKLEIIVIVHSDIFPVIPTSVLDMLENYDIASTFETRSNENHVIRYLYPAFTIINMEQAKELEILDFSCAHNINFTVDDKKLTYSLDTGGCTYMYIEKFKNNIKILQHIQLNAPQSFNSMTQHLKKYFKHDYYLCQKYRLANGWYLNGFFHYVSGSRWDVIDNNKIKYNNSKNCIDASNYIKNWFKFHLNRKKSIGHIRRLETCLGFFSYNII